MNTPGGATRVVAGAPIGTNSAVPRGGRAQLANLAFGSLNRREETALTTSGMDPGRHLAFVTSDALDLDLSDESQRRFGDYELLELVGEGGMGVVYRARQLSLDREVAVKLLSAGPWASRDFVERFQREAQNAARMQHPNIVPIHEVGTIEGLHFFSMRLIRGTSLAAQVKLVGRLPALQAAQLLRVVAEAVDYAHRLGVLHLDLKPANVLLDENGEPHVADFGLARRLDQMRAADNTEVSGTPSYMAPEQATARAQKITPATDIWGLGAVLYELVTGTPPFLADSAQATLQLVVQGNLRSPRDIAADLPRDLEAIILKCMAREAGERYASARELADDLGRFLDNRPVRARSLNRAQRTWCWARREPRLAAVTLFAFAALLAGLAATTQQRRRADRNAATASGELWDSREADASRLYDSRDGWKAAPLLLANIREMEQQHAAERLVGTRKRLGILINANPRLIDVWPVQSNVTGIAFSPDGERLVVGSQGNGIRAFDVASGREAFRAEGHAGQMRGTENVITYLWFTPQGGSIIATSVGLGRDPDAPQPLAASMVRLDAATGAWLEPPSAFADFLDASYSADGRFAALTNRSEQAQFWATDPWRPLSPLRAPPPLSGNTSRLVAPDGSLFVQDTHAHAVALVDSHTLQVRKRVELGDVDSVVAWTFSPDAHWLALGDNKGAIAVIDCRTFAVQRPSPQPYFRIGWLTFSEDGDWLAAAAGAGGVFLWSWPDGRLLTPPFSGSGFAGGKPLAEHVLLDRARGLVLSSDETDSTALWRVAPTADAADRTDAVPIMDRLDATRRIFVEAIAWDAPRGLIASVDDRRLRLERLPAPVLKQGRAARLMPGTLRFDGKHLVELNNRAVQIVDARNEQPVGKLLNFAQPPDFAELTADGATLVVIVGRRLQAFNTDTGSPRFAPIELGGSPDHVDISPDGARVVAAWWDNDEQGDRSRSELTSMYSLSDGKLLGGPFALPAQAYEMAFSADGRRFLAWHKAHLSLRDGLNLAPIPGPLADFRPRGTSADPRDGTMPVARFDAGGNVVMAFGRRDKQDWHYELHRYGADGGVLKTPLSSVQITEILPLAQQRGTVVFGGYGGTTVIADDGTVRDFHDEPDDTERAFVVTSPDGRWLARAQRDGVSLFDLDQFVRVATLRVALPRPDMVWQLAFSADGNQLLARSMHGRLMAWDLRPEQRAPAAIARELELRDRDVAIGAGLRTSVDPDAVERAALRANDLETSPPASAPSPAETLRDLPGGGIPPRSTEAPPETLDLTNSYTFGLREPLPTLENGGGDFHWLPQGVQRVLGVDYDIRGGIGLRAPLDARINLDAADATTPGRAVAAIDVLFAFQGEGVDHFADVQLNYADGSRAELPVGLDGKDLHYWNTPGKPLPALFAAWGWDARIRLASHGLACVSHAVNPHPERRVTTLTLSAPGNAALQATILAVSIEPVATVAAPSITTGGK